MKQAVSNCSEVWAQAHICNGFTLYNQFYVAMTVYKDIVHTIVFIVNLQEKKNKYFPFLLYINTSVESYSCCVGMTCNSRRKKDMHLLILNYELVINYKG